MEHIIPLSVIEATLAKIKRVNKDYVAASYDDIAKYANGVDLNQPTQIYMQAVLPYLNSGSQVRDIVVNVYGLHLLCQERDDLMNVIEYDKSSIFANEVERFDEGLFLDLEEASLINEIEMHKQMIDELSSRLESNKKQNEEKLKRLQENRERQQKLASQPSSNE